MCAIIFYYIIAIKNQLYLFVKGSIIDIKYYIFLSIQTIGKSMILSSNTVGPDTEPCLTPRSIDILEVF